jgi:hypothetical protein
MVVTRSAGAVALAEPVRLDRGWCLGSDGEGKFSEGCRKLMSRVDVGGEFVVAAAEVLHERVP